MKKIISISIFVMLFSCSLFAQKLGAARSNAQLNIPKKINKLVLDPLPAGTYTIGIAGDFPTIDSAFSKLSVDGIAGPIELLLIDTLYIAPSTSNGFLLNGPISGANKYNYVWIRAENSSVTIEGDGGCVLTFLNTSYLELGNSVRTRKPAQFKERADNTTGIVIRAKYNTQFKYNDCIHFLNNSDHNVIQSITIINEDYLRSSLGIGFWPTDINNPSATDSNVVKYNFIKKAGWGIYFEGPKNQKATDNLIYMNSIGSETDSLIGWGIQLFNCQNTLVENNILQNLKLTENISGDIINVGINSYWGSGDTIRNNIVHNIKSNSGYTSTGILLSGSSGESGSNNLVYNNMVYDIQSTSTHSDSRVAGIQMWQQNNPKIYYNSVFLSGNGANHQGSAALYIYDGLGTSTNVDVKDNILVSTRDESLYFTSAIYDYTTSNLTSDYNVLLSEPGSNNCLVKIGTNKYITLADWQTTSSDLHSYTEMPHFIEEDLHIDKAIPTNLESHGIPIAGIDVDFDGDARGVDSTDIGADEFEGTVIVGVNDKITQPLVFNLEQNYPNPFNPTTKIKYTVAPPNLPNGEALVQLKVYDILGREVGTLINEIKAPGNYEIEFNAASLSSGVYFYQLRVSALQSKDGRAGEFISTKKMILLK